MQSYTLILLFLHYFYARVTFIIINNIFSVGPNQSRKNIAEKSLSMVQTDVRQKYIHTHMMYDLFSYRYASSIAGGSA